MAGKKAMVTKGKIMENIIKPKIIKVSEDKNNTAIFEIKPCYPGYGMTLGNALRRVLLSSLSGAAITDVKIKGVSHEFTTVPNVLEDFVEILLNLKQVRLKMDSSEESLQAELKISGEKEVKAGDIKTPTGVQVVNKNLHIATVTDKKASLEMTFTIKKGIGYAEVRQNEKDIAVGAIAIDAIFSPVVKVNYEIENMRVGQMTNYNKIKMEIQTDGTIDPEESLVYAVKILVNQFRSLIDDDQEDEEAVHGEIKEEDVKEDFDEYAEAPEALKISELELSKRTVKILEENNIQTVNKLASKSKEAISNLPGIGAKGFDEISGALNELGLSLKE